MTPPDDAGRDSFVFGAARAAARAGVIASLLAAAVLFGTPTRASASPWTPRPGHGYAKVWLKWLPGFGYLDGRGESTAFGTYHEVFANAWAEVGVAEGVALWLHAPLAQGFVLADPRPGGDTRAVVGPGDPMVGGRWRFARVGRFVAAAELGLGVPLATSRAQGPVFARETPHAQLASLHIGSGVFRGMGALAVGYGWDTVYAAGSLGYVLRSGGWDDVLTWTAEVGGRFSATLSGRLRATGWHPVVRGSAPRGESPSGIVNGTAYTGFGLEGEWQFVPRWYLGMTIEGGIAGVRRQSGGPVLSLFAATQF